MEENFDPNVEDLLIRLRNANNDKVETLIAYLKMIHPKWISGKDEVRYNYNPEPQDNKAVKYFDQYGINLKDLAFDKIMNEFQKQDENKMLSLEQKNEIQDILTGYLSKKEREERDKKIKQKGSLGKRKRSLGGKKKSKRKNSKKRNTKKNKK